ncbi:hypothetical protein H9X96_19230 [Pedobacter sp. N36a]|uniref:hypothetical protein n=1 Tax=Pedobacter sp. N36a TaxID=2767996 RepID=UPI001656F120|nr:hypothetical protein [Pedobacter sp. N36a]MBC8987895.1 hypothetical protein [Pedobacter sp. N36a]
MKRLLITMLALLPFNLLHAVESHPIATVKIKIYTIDASIPAVDTIKKEPSAKEWAKMERQLKKQMPKDLAKIMIQQMRSVMPGNGGLIDAASLSKFAVESEAFSTEMDAALDKSDYELERKEIIEVFKSMEFDNASDRSVARKEMKQDLKRLKEVYQRSKIRLASQNKEAIALNVSLR